MPVNCMLLYMNLEWKQMGKGQMASSKKSFGEAGSLVVVGKRSILWK